VVTSTSTSPTVAVWGAAGVWASSMGSNDDESALPATWSERVPGAAPTAIRRTCQSGSATDAARSRSNDAGSGSQDTIRPR